MIPKQFAVAKLWDRYWFKPGPLLDLAILRILAVGVQLGLITADPRYTVGALKNLDAIPDVYFHPLPFLKLILLPFDGQIPSIEMIQFLHLAAIVSGILALVGLWTSLSLGVLAVCSMVVQLWALSHGDIHHPEAAMMVSLVLLALSPAGRMLSLDAWRARRKGRPLTETIDATDTFATWPILLIQWFFALMYLSAAYAKFSISGFDWANGYTLQYYLASDGLRNDRPLGVWLSQQHEMVVLMQWGVLFFQSTFFMSLIVPRLKWFYASIGMALHIGIYILLAAPFFQWMALYCVFMPWSAALRLIRSRRQNRQSVAASAPRSSMEALS